LEIGPGVGFIIEAMATSADAHFTGLDISQSMIDKAANRLRAMAINASFCHYDGVTVPLPDGSLDLILEPSFRASLIGTYPDGASRHPDSRAGDGPATGAQAAATRSPSRSAHL
jgi:hypothetical protein